MANTKMEIMVNGKAFEVANKDLGKNLKNILSEMAKMHKSSWAYAKAYHNIIKKELWKDDFEKQKDFAGFMGITNGAISQLVGGVDFINEHNNFTEENISVTNAYLMKTVSIKDENDKKVNKTDEFINWLSENGHGINAGTTSKTLKDWIKEYKESFTVIDVEATETDVEKGDVESKDPAEELYNLFIVQSKIVDGHPVYMVTETVYGTSENGEDYKEIRTTEYSPVDFAAYLVDVANLIGKSEMYRIKDNKLANELKNR